MNTAPQRDALSPSAQTDLQRDLEAQLAGDVRFDKIYRAMHSTDASVYQIMPLGVVAPRSTADVIQTVKLCHRHGASITARGGGTSQAGQAIGNGIQLNFSKYMDRVLQLDTAAKTVRVEPGIVLDELNAQLKPHGLHLPLDLSTANRATIGGMIANNSAGTRSIIYGKTLDYVEELKVVLADGSLVHMGPLEAAELQVKSTQQDHEGACYRVLQQLAAEHRDEIHRRYPKILRRVGGYNLDEFVPNDRPFNLARILVGSEGTLGLTVEATLRLVPLPKARALCTIEFTDILQAMAATPLILSHQPSAVELIDRFILDTTRGKPQFESLRDFIVGDPGAVLIVEFFGASPDQLPQRIDRLQQDLRRQGFNGPIHRAFEDEAQGRIWELRQAALGLSMSQTGDAKSISFVEDTAVDPNHLHDYIARFQAVLAKYDTQAGFYAHASVGLLHIRPVVNMKTADGIEKFERIATEIAALVLEYGGALSGEHGDGLARAPFQERIFGPVLYQAFCQLKSGFDPDGLLNPGKIVNAPSLTENLRFGPDYATPKIDTTFGFADFGGITRATEQCSGVGACRKRQSGTMCPSYMAVGDEMASTRGRANALRLALSGQLGNEGLSNKELYPVLDLCLECKACKSECPTGVDMARLKSEFLHQYHNKHGASFSARSLANAAQIARWGSRLAPLSNWLSASGAVRWLNEKILGLDRRRPLPSFARQSFLDQWDQPPPGDQPGVALFVDTFSNFYEPQHLTAAARLIERLGARPVAVGRVCCGRPLISKGFLDRAARQAAATTQILTPLVQQGLPILFCEPSCYSAVRDDHPHLLRGAAKIASEKVAAACLTFEEWAAARLADPSVTLDLEPGTQKILFHGHCHQKALTGTKAPVQLLSQIPGSEVIPVDSGCCGLAGSFGYETNHYEISQAVGERKLLPAVRALGSDGVVVTSGFSCRQQIAHFTDVRAHSPMTLLDSLTRHPN
jgi:FAD/FMN-containing dehydrogenase/Fe-S oxidoreductase